MTDGECVPGNPEVLFCGVEGGGPCAANPCDIAATCPLPAPVLDASTIDPTVAFSVSRDSTFLYTGPNAIQYDVAQGSASPFFEERVGVVHGRVLATDGNPLPGVRVEVVDQPEFGWTATRTDGAYDLVVNGGGLLRFRFSTAGHISADRAVEVDWRQQVVLDDVVLVPIAGPLNEIVLGGDPGTVHVAVGSLVTVLQDVDGARRAVLLIPDDAEPRLEFDDGQSPLPINEFDLYITEITVGEAGPTAMPAELPP